MVIGAIFAPASAQRGAPPVPVPLSPLLRDYQPVTAERLKNPEDEQLADDPPAPTTAGATVRSIRSLRPTSRGCVRSGCSRRREARVHEAAPIVNNGVMFVTTPNNQVIAIDAKSGNAALAIPAAAAAGRMSCLHETNRGVALYGDKVYYAAGEAVLVALDARTGREVWTTTVADNKSGYYITLAPLVAGGKVDGWRVGRRVRHPRLRGGVRSRDRQGAVADLHRSRRRESRAARRGRRASSGRPAARRCG